MLRRQKHVLSQSTTPFACNPFWQPPINRCESSRFDPLRNSVSPRGGRNKGGRKQMRANANKRRQTLTNASKCRGENASKRKQTLESKRKQMLTPPFIAVFYTRLCNALRNVHCESGHLSSWGCWQKAS